MIDSNISSVVQNADIERKECTNTVLSRNFT